MNFMNTERFFSEVLPHISPLTAGEELIENAQRAGASEIVFSYDGGVKVEIANNGEDVTDLLSMFVVADTHYSNENVSVQNPAGMGMLLILSGVEKIELRSQDNALAMISDSFFKDASYRDSLKMTKGKGSIKGLDMDLYFKKKEDALSFITKVKELLHRHTIEITVLENNKTIKVEPFKKENTLGQIAFGKDCDPRWKNCVITLNEFKNSDYCSSILFWFGKKVYLPSNGLFSFTIEVVGENEFLSPNLPDRSKVNQSLEELKKFFSDLILEFKPEVSSYLQHIKATSSTPRAVEGIFVSAIERNIVPESVLNDFTLWAGVEKKKLDRVNASNGLVVTTEKFYDNTEGYTINGAGGYYFEISDYSSDYYETENLVELRNQKYAPEWYKHAYKDADKDIEVSFDEVKDIPNANYTYIVIKNLKINGVSLSPFAFYNTEQDTMYVTASFLETEERVEVFAHMCATAISSRSESSYDDIKFEVYEDITSWNNYVNKEINVSDLIYNIQSTLEKDHTFIVETISFDHENKKILINDTYTLGF